MPPIIRGVEEVFGGLPPRASSSAMRAKSALICFRSSSIVACSELFCSRRSLLCSKRSLFCSKSSSIFANSDSNNLFWLSASSESIPSGGIPSLNHDAITGHRGTHRMLRARGKRDSGVSNYLIMYCVLSSDDGEPGLNVGAACPCATSGEARIKAAIVAETPLLFLAEERRMRTSQSCFPIGALVHRHFG